VTGSIVRPASRRKASRPLDPVNDFRQPTERELAARRRDAQRVTSLLARRFGPNSDIAQALGLVPTEGAIQ
jgi:hypothetical protein